MAFTISIVRLGGPRAKKPLASIALPKDALAKAKSADDIIAAVKKAVPNQPVKTAKETRGSYLKRLVLAKPVVKPIERITPK